MRLIHIFRHNYLPLSISSESVIGVNVLLMKMLFHLMPENTQDRFPVTYFPYFDFFEAFIKRESYESDMFTLFEMLGARSKIASGEKMD